MKRIVLFVLLVAWTSAAVAQHARIYRTPVKRASLAGVEYHNFSRTAQTIDLAGENILLYAPTVRGVAFTSGHSFLLHERPFFRLIHLGFDVNWFDAEYANWQRRIDGHGKWMHKADISIGAGPALHFSPVGRLGVHLYFHYDPTLSVVTHNFAGDEDGKFELVAGYASYFSSGFALSWDIFSLGAEWRHGEGIYHGIRIPDVTITPDRIIDEIIDLDIKDALDRCRHTMRGWRLFLSFRF
jgi:hypothetical protein